MKIYRHQSNTNNQEKPALNEIAIDKLPKTGYGRYIDRTHKKIKEILVIGKKVFTKKDNEYVHTSTFRRTINDMPPPYQQATISQRLKAVDLYAGKNISDYVRTLFPEIVEMERAEGEGRGSQAELVGEEEQPAEASEHPTLPDRAPALWAEAKEPGDTPPAFIQRHYAPWLGKGLSRAHLLHLDKPLYRALTNWLQNPKHRLPEGFDLPTKSESWAADPGGETPAEVREARRIVSRWDKRQARARTAER